MLDEYYCSKIKSLEVRLENLRAIHEEYNLSYRIQELPQLYFSSINSIERIEKKIQKMYEEKERLQQKILFCR